MSGGVLEVGRSAGLDGLKLRRFVRFMHVAYPFEVKRLRKTGQSWLALDWAKRFGEDIEYVSADHWQLHVLKRIDGRFAQMLEEKQRHKIFAPLGVF